MALKHVMKLTDTEAVVKCYVVDSAGGNVDISLQNDLTATGQTWVNDGSANVGIQEIYWGAKSGKQIDMTRITDADANTTHGHYYLLNAGYYDFVGFVDNVYANKDIRISFDGPGHVILKLRKTSGWSR
jgi:hypothetical protein